MVLLSSLGRLFFLYVFFLYAFHWLIAPKPCRLAGGTLDTDRDVDDPADLGVWWGDSLPSGRMRSSLSDSDSF